MKRKNFRLKNVDKTEKKKSKTDNSVAGKSSLLQVNETVFWIDFQWLRHVWRWVRATSKSKKRADGNVNKCRESGHLSGNPNGKRKKPLTLICFFFVFFHFIRLYHFRNTFKCRTSVMHGKHLIIVIILLFCQSKKEKIAKQKQKKKTNATPLIQRKRRQIRRKKKTN